MTTTVDIRAQLGLEPLNELTKYLNILIYGEPNAGKTYLAATAQDHKDTSPVIHLGFEQGLLTVAYRKNYDACEIRTIEELEQVYTLLAQDQQSAKPHYKTLIIDNGTELQNLDIDTIMRETKKNARNPDNVDIDVPSPREWGKIGKRLRRVTRGLRDLEMHTIWTAWKGEWQDEATNITHYYPKLSGHMKHEFSGYFDIVGYLRSDTNSQDGSIKTLLQVQETNRVKAKWRNRPQEVPALIENPTIPMIWEYVQKSKVA